MNPAGIERAISSGGVANHAKLLLASSVHSGAEFSQEQESSALTTTAWMPIRSVCRLSRVLRNQCIPLPLIHVLNVRLSLHQRPTDLAAASPFPILVLTIPRLSGCRPSFIDNHKAHSLIKRHSLSFTSLVGVTVIRFHLYAIHHFHLTISFNPNRLIDLCKSPTISWASSLESNHGPHTPAPLSSPW